MAIAVTLRNDTPDNTQDQFLVDGTMVLTGNYGGGATHGDTLNLSGFDQIKASTVPIYVEVYEAPPAGTSATGYTFIFCPGTTQANGVIQIFGTGASAGAAPQEYTQGSAYNAALLAVVLKFRAWFTSLI